MIISFFGHRNFCATEASKTILMDILETLAGSQCVEFYLGGYGGFDVFAYQCCYQYQKTHPHVKLIFVSPYLSSNYLQEKTEKYDCVIYPEIEKIPPKLAILYRNRYMIEKSDFVIAYIRYQRGGAYQAVVYAEKKGKTIIRF